MHKLLFVCHGNICRSPMAEFLMKDIVERAGEAHRYHIESAACHTDALGCRPHRGTRAKLSEVGISTDGKTARLIERTDYGKFDYIIAMDSYNVYDMLRLFGGDPEGKIKMLLEFCGENREVADPWYTGNFDDTYNDCLKGCRALYKYLTDKGA